MKLSKNQLNLLIENYLLESEVELTEAALSIDDIIEAVPDGVKVVLAKNINKAVGPSLVAGINKLLKGQNFKPSEETASFPDLKKPLHHCAEYVNKVTRSAGSAWVQGNNATTSGFDNVYSEANIRIIEKAFNHVHKTKSVGKSSPYYSKLQKIAIEGIMPKEEAMKVKIGDIVGLIYKTSTYYPQAFFESASGYYMDASQTGQGTFFVAEETNKPYTPDDDKTTTYKYDTSTGPFSFNTHIGFVGATINDKPIVFHNIHGHVHLTPIDALYSKKHTTIGMTWKKAGPSAVEVVLDDVKLAAKDAYSFFADITDKSKKIAKDTYHTGEDAASLDVVKSASGYIDKASDYISKL